MAHFGEAQGSYPDEGITYCIVALHPDRLATFFDATPGSGSTRGDDALDRKAGRADTQLAKV